MFDYFNIAFHDEENSCRFRQEFLQNIENSIPIKIVFTVKFEYKARAYIR